MAYISNKPLSVGEHAFPKTQFVGLSAYASGDFCTLLITFPNSLDLDQNVRS